MIKVLWLEWDSFGQEYIRQELQAAGCQITIYPWNCQQENMRKNESLTKELKKVLLENTYHFVFSLNFYPVAAQACWESGTKYAAWVYDSPFLLLYSQTITYPTNYVFLFDQTQYQQFCSQGIETVYYLPMAAPVDYYDRLMNDKLENESCEQHFYQSEVSFVGSTYSEERQSFGKLLDGITDYTKGYLDAIISVQKEVWGAFLLEELLSPEVLADLQHVCPMERSDDEWESDEWIYANYFLARQVTAQERHQYLCRLSEEHQVKLFTPEATPNLPYVENMGPVDYQWQMPRVFQNSKINLNITLRSIHSGIPLRAMDIMGCGGFLLTNYQQDFLTYFEPDVDFVYFTDEKDLLQKVQYYLEHEEERRQIAKNGYQKVKRFHTYRHRIQTILSQLLTQQEEHLYSQMQIWEEKNRDNKKWYLDCWEKKEQSADDLEQESNGFFECLENEKGFLSDFRNALVQYIDYLLEQGYSESWEMIAALFRKRICQDMCLFFSELNVIRNFLLIFEKEKEKNQVTITRYASIQILCQLYQQLVFYYRRLEYNMEEQEEMIPFIREQGISVEVLIVVLQQADIAEKEKVWSKLIQLMTEV